MLGSFKGKSASKYISNIGDNVGRPACKVGAEVPGSFWADIASKGARNIAVWAVLGPPHLEDGRCLEVLRPKLPAKRSLTSEANLGPAHLQDGRQGAWKYQSRV